MRGNQREKFFHENLQHQISKPGFWCTEHQLTVDCHVKAKPVDLAEKMSCRVKQIEHGTVLYRLATCARCNRRLEKSDEPNFY